MALVTIFVRISDRNPLELRKRPYLAPSEESFRKAEAVFADHKVCVGARARNGFYISALCYNLLGLGFDIRAVAYPISRPKLLSVPDDLVKAGVTSLLLQPSWQYAEARFP